MTIFPLQLPHSARRTFFDLTYRRSEAGADFHFRQPEPGPHLAIANYGTVRCSGAGPDEAQHECRTTGRAPDIAGHLVPPKGPPSATVNLLINASFSFGGLDIWYLREWNGSHLTTSACLAFEEVFCISLDCHWIGKTQSQALKWPRPHSFSLSVIFLVEHSALSFSLFSVFGKVINLCKECQSRLHVYSNEKTCVIDNRSVCDDSFKVIPFDVVTLLANKFV